MAALLRTTPHATLLDLAARGAVVVSIGVDDDVGLVEKVRAGEEAAFAELVRRYQPRLLRLAEATDGRAYNLLPAACCVLLAFPR